MGGQMCSSGSRQKAYNIEQETKTNKTKIKLKRNLTTEIQAEDFEQYSLIDVNKKSVL